MVLDTIKMAKFKKSLYSYHTERKGESEREGEKERERVRERERKKGRE